MSRAIARSEVVDTPRQVLPDGDASTLIGRQWVANQGWRDRADPDGARDFSRVSWGCIF